MIPVRSGLAVLRHRTYARYALCRFLTTLSWQMLAVALGWQVYAMTHDPLALGLVGLSEFLPFVCLVLIGGHVADHVERRAVLLVMWSINSVCIAALLWYLAQGATRVWPIYLALAVFGASRAFWWPCTQSLLPNLVPAHEFGSAVGVNSTLFQMAVITGPALGGVLYLLGTSTVFGTCLVMFLLTVLIVPSLRPPQFAEDEAGTAAVVPHEPSGHEMLEGLRYVLRHKAVLGVISLDLFAVLFGGATALLPIYAGDILHIGPSGLGWLRSAPGVGAALMALLLMWRPIERRAGPIMFGGVAAFGVATVVFGLSTSFWLSLAALAVLGAGDMASVYVRAVLVQLKTPDSIRGRVSAVNALFIGTSNELGEFESGVTARWFGAVRAVVLGGVLTLAVVAVWLRLFPQLRQLDRLHGQD